MNIIAHRGASGKAPENTGIAFKKAVEDKADGVEFDIHYTKDRELVVIHDNTVDRTTDGKGKIENLTLGELKKLDAGSYYDQNFQGEKILTLAETLDIVKDMKVINIEVKGEYMSDEFLHKLFQHIDEYNIIKRVIISSFNHYLLHKIKRIDQNIKTGILYFAAIYNPWEYANKLRADAIHPHYQSITLEVVSGCHENNIKINAFGINNENEITKMKKLGIDSIITDYPAFARELLQSSL